MSGRVFPTVEEQRKLNAEHALKLRRTRLKKAGCDEATVVSFTTARIDLIRARAKS